MNHARQRRILGAAVAAAALAAPAVAMSHGSVFEVTARTVPTGATPPITPGMLVDQTQYVVTNHGYTMVLRESNGALDQGMINFKWLPGAYRNQPGFEPGPAGTRTRLLSEGDTGAQPHATCRGVGALGEPQILAWQEADPFYNYVPWQKTPAGLQDEAEVATWIGVVKTATGVDLSTLNTVTDFTNACASIGGTYTPADAIVTTAAALASGTIADATAAATGPLNAQIGTLNTKVADLTAARDAAEALVKSLTDKVKQLFLPLRASLEERTIPVEHLGEHGAHVNLTGPARTVVTLKLLVAPAKAKALGLKWRVLSTGRVRLDADGKATVHLKPTRVAAAALARAKGAIPVTVAVDQSTWTKATLVP
jgi:hypothetical protein